MCNPHNHKSCHAMCAWQEAGLWDHTLDPTMSYCQFHTASGQLHPLAPGIQLGPSTQHPQLWNSGSPCCQDPQSAAAGAESPLSCGTSQLRMVHACG